MILQSMYTSVACKRVLTTFKRNKRRVDTHTAVASLRALAIQRNQTSSIAEACTTYPTENFLACTSYPTGKFPVLNQHASPSSKPAALTRRRLFIFGIRFCLGCSGCMNDSYVVDNGQGTERPPCHFCKACPPLWKYQQYSIHSLGHTSLFATT